VKSHTACKTFHVAQRRTTSELWDEEFEGAKSKVAAVLRKVFNEEDG
jgi:hypothetical protein